MDVRQLAAIVAVADHGTFSAPRHGRSTPSSPTCPAMSPSSNANSGVNLVDRSNGSLDRGGHPGRRAGPPSPPRDRRHRGRHRLARRRRVRRRPDRRDRHDRAMADAAAARRRRRAAPARPPDRAARAAPRRSCPGSCPGQLNAAIIHLPIDDPELVVEPLFAEDLLLLVHASHQLAGRDDDVAHRARRRPAPAATQGRRAATRPRPSGRQRRRSACGRRPRSTACACSRHSRSTATAPRSCRPPPPHASSTATSVGSPCPSSLAASSRGSAADDPAPSAATSAVASILTEVVRTHADDQPGVHLGIRDVPAPSQPAVADRRLDADVERCPSTQRETATAERPSG